MISRKEGSMAEKEAGKRVQTEYPGVWYRWTSRKGPTGQSERIYYVGFRRSDGKWREAKAGSDQRNNMTAALAAQIRADLIRGKELTPPEKRKEERRKAQAEADKWTFDKIAVEYFAQRPDCKSKKSDEGRYRKILKETFGPLEPSQVQPLMVDKLRIGLSKKYATQTVVHALNQLRRLSRFGGEKQLAAPIPFRIKFPKVDNEKVAVLSDAQMDRLLVAIDGSTNEIARDLIKWTLLTGRRREESFSLKWSAIDLDRKIYEFVAGKTRKTNRLPLSEEAVDLLKEIRQRRPKDEYVFQGRSGRRVDIHKAVRAICDAAGLPRTFRPLHDSRHLYASKLASDGVSLYIIQRLLAQEDPRSCKRYSHLTEDSLRQATALAAPLITLKTPSGTTRKNIEQK